MVSKEPDHLLTGQSNSKSTLTDKLPGTMTVRSVLLNRDSPDIESRLKRRRNRTHQVRFKDLEDGSSSSGNSATGENNTRQRPAKDRDSPHPLRKYNSMSQHLWSDRPITESLLGQTSVVGAVRGDMASTIEKVAAFLARAPPHPLTPGPTRRCWAPPQSNSLTLPMTRRSSTSTSTAIQTSPCLKKPQSLSSTHVRSHSIGDSVGVDGDDEHDSQDEYLSHNHVLPGSKDQSRPSSSVDKTGVERRSKVSRTEIKSGVIAKTSRHSCPPSVLHNSDLCHSSSVSCRDGPKRQGSSTPSVIRRRKRLSRTTSDPGKEVHLCTTPTQTESPPQSPSPLNTKLCTTEVQTEGLSSPPISKRCTTKCETEHKHQSPTLSVEHCSAQIQTRDSCPTLPQNGEQCTPKKQTNSPSPSSQNQNHCTTQLLTCSSVDSSPPILTSSLNSDTPISAPADQIPPTTNISTVPYTASPAMPINAPVQTPEQCSKACSSSPTKLAIFSPPPPDILSITSSTCATNTSQSSIPYYTVLSPPTPPGKASICSSPSFTVPQSSSHNCISPLPHLISSSSCPIPTPTVSTILTPCVPIIEPNAAPNVRHQQPSTSLTNNVPTTNLTPCTIVTQTALSCTSISYYTSTHPSGPHVPHINQTSPSYTTVIQTVSHCNIPYQTVQNIPPTSTGMTLYPSPVPRLESCTSPPPNVKAYVSTLQNAQAVGTPTKAVPLYSSTFRAAPPYTPPSQAPYNAQDKRGIRLPPPPPPPPPYTPRKKGSEPAGTTARTPMLRTESKVSEKVVESEEKKPDTKDVQCTDLPKLCGGASSLKHRAQTPPVAVMKGERRSSTSSPAKACFKPSCLSSAQAQLGVLHKMLCSGASIRPNTPNSQCSLPPNQQGCSSARGCSASGEQSGTGPLSPTQADTLRQVQEILGGLMSGARCKLDPSRVTEKLLSPNGPLHDIRSLQNQLHSLEGVLETSQNTIKVLLDVIQDLEKKEAERDGRHSYRTGQDIENCGTCRDCACIIYRSTDRSSHNKTFVPLHASWNVEHDFRLQEGQVVRTWKVGDPPEGSPQTLTPQATTPHQQESPQLVRPPATTKKNRKKCFWFL
ncbi:flocculation protein FLO11 isoform X3 [Cyprinodon tularosa]|uniref:flocculation protein FLO11 isoform X3 n=1 Tax=Cyprinodon tularosa TaxID=77115 RepID=UPI0018E270FB|nr:flocculation protein FLO11 isoform X3 [Cyprinodon tularosa]